MQPQAELRSSYFEGVRMDRNDLIPIGTLAKRTGLSVSAIRYYESRGLLTAVRSTGNQRRFLRSDIRRLSFVLIAQRMGLTLGDIEQQLIALPQGRTPTRDDWRAFGKVLGGAIDARIDLLQRMRDRLGACIGCGCLSLANCALYNADDAAAQAGPGPRFVLG
jgi:MerR family redox-sensitive transcriptional activator SoxR